MPLIRCKCESCGANLEVDSENNLFVCKYCGAKFIHENSASGSQDPLPVFDDETQLKIYEDLKKLYFENRIDELVKVYESSGLQYKPLEYLIRLKTEYIWKYTSKEYNYFFEAKTQWKDDIAFNLITSYTKNYKKDKELTDALAQANSYVDDEVTREYIRQLKAHILDDVTVKDFVFDEWMRLYGDTSYCCPWKSNQLDSWPSYESILAELEQHTDIKILPSDYKERLAKIYNDRKAEANERIQQQEAQLAEKKAQDKAERAADAKSHIGVTIFFFVLAGVGLVATIFVNVPIILKIVFGFVTLMLFVIAGVLTQGMTEAEKEEAEKKRTNKK